MYHKTLFPVLEMGFLFLKISGDQLHEVFIYRCNAYSVFFSSQAFCQVPEIHHLNVGSNGTTILIDAGNRGYFSLVGCKR
jgi:hypothetical protein